MCDIKEPAVHDANHKKPKNDGDHVNVLIIIRKKSKYNSAVEAQIYYKIPPPF